MTMDLLEVTDEDGLLLRGHRVEGGNEIVLMFHAPGDDRDLDDVTPLIGGVVCSGASAAMFDLRGHGFSEGVWHGLDDAVTDIQTLIKWARSGGAEMVAIVALGSTCYGALQAVNRERVDALVLISPPPLPVDIDIKQVRGAGESKCIISGTVDPDARAAVNSLQTRSIGWVMTTMLGTTDQEEQLVHGEHGPRINRIISKFLKEQWMIGRQRDVSIASKMEERKT